MPNATLKSTKDCIAGSHLIAQARKIDPLDYKKFVFKDNEEYWLIKRKGRGGIVSICEINKETSATIKNQIRLKLTCLRIAFNKGDCLQANDIICECKDSSRGRVLSNVTARHGAQLRNFFGDHSFAFISEAFRLSCFAPLDSTYSLRDLHTELSADNDAVS